MRMVRSCFMCGYILWMMTSWPACIHRSQVTVPSKVEPLAPLCRGKITYADAASPLQNMHLTHRYCVPVRVYVLCT